jgi:nucleoside phosphorylase
MRQSQQPIMQSNPPKIFIYTALPCEAKPLIDYFRLKKNVQINPFAVFANDTLCLTVTGIGKNAMAAGIAYTQALLATAAYPVLVNVGIAGHRDHELGELFIIDKITDAETQKRYYPPLVFKPPCPSANVRTAAKPQLDYAHAELCDMEASAFYETAVRFSSGELIQCLKVISDNAATPAGQINAPSASALIAARLESIVQVVEQLAKLAHLLDTTEPPGFAELLGHYRFSMSEQRQLKAQLLRWSIVTGGNTLDVDKAALHSGKAVLKWLEQKISDTAFYL